MVRSISITRWESRPIRGAAGRGVLVVLNDWIHGAGSLTKTSTTAVQTFLSPISGLIGTVSYGQPEFYRGPVGKNTTTSEFSVDNNTVLPRVDIIMASENMDGAMINAAVAGRGKRHRDRRRRQRQHDGIRGHRARGAGEKGNRLRAFIAGRPRGMSVGTSRSTMTSYGFVASLGLNPQKARVLLRLALTKTSDPKVIQRYFDGN